MFGISRVCVVMTTSSSKFCPPQLRGSALVEIMSPNAELASSLGAALCQDPPCTGFQRHERVDQQLPSSQPAAAHQQAINHIYSNVQASGLSGENLVLGQGASGKLAEQPHTQRALTTSVACSAMRQQHMTSTRSAYAGRRAHAP
jgi:hypothetical protein